MCKKLLEKYNKKIKKMVWQDIGILKMAVFFFALMIADMYKPILDLEWYVYGIVFVVLYAIMLKRINK